MKIGDKVRINTDDSFDGLIGTLCVLQDPERTSNKRDRYGLEISNHCGLYWFAEGEIESLESRPWWA